MKRLLLLMLIVPCVVQAQKGISFEHNTAWSDIKAKAKAENKYIFMDAFTTWCGPCRYMSKNIFPQPEVGDFFNSKFINVKVQLDTTNADDTEVKKWYADAHAIMRDYKVNVFPTYLFFSPDGKLVHRSVGASEAPEFLTKGKDALNPDKQFYTLYDQYKQGKKAPAFLKDLSLAAMAAFDQDVLKDASTAYFNSGEDLLAKDNIRFVNDVTTNVNDPGFKLMNDNAGAFDAELGKGFTNRKLTSLISQQEVFPKIFSKQFKNSDWDELQSTVAAKYPAQADEVISTAKVVYYQNTKDWKNFQASIVPYMSKYGANVPDAQLNDFAWAVFENCSDMACVKEALAWSKRSFEKGNQPEFIDTYANLLYKMGKKKEAIEWEKKALALAPANDKGTYQETLDKMNKGEKTWND